MGGETPKHGAERTSTQGAANPPPPPPPADGPAKSSERGTTSTPLAVILGGTLAGVALLLVLLPLLFFVPSVWVALLIALAALAAALWLLRRVARSKWLLPVGLVCFLLPVTLIALTPMGDDPVVPKPTPWEGEAWVGTEVEYWELSTGSRVGYVHFPADNPIPDTSPIMFLHGGPGGGVVPRDGDFARDLNEFGFEVYLYDQAGVGWSELLEPDEYTVDRMVADLEAIRVEIGADTLNLVGHSWGGSLAAHYTSAHDANVEHTWLSNPGPYGGDFVKRAPAEEPDLTAATGASFLKGAPHYRMGFANALMGFGRDPDVAESFASQEQLIRYGPDYINVIDSFQDGKCAGDPFTEEELAFAPATNFNLYANALINGDVSDHDPVVGLPTITTPFVIARGVCDYVPWDAQRQYRDNIPGASLVVIPNIGHAMRPAEEIAAFFATGEPPLEPYLSDDVPSPG